MIARRMESFPEISPRGLIPIRSRALWMSDGRFWKDSSLARTVPEDDGRVRPLMMSFQVFAPVPSSASEKETS